MAESKQKAPAPPKGLSAPARDLWKRVVKSVPSEFELDDRELAVLMAACRQFDHLVLLEEVVEKDGPTATGSTGQVIVHPALVEARQARLALSRLLGQLEIPDPEEVPRSQSSLRAKRAADVRWDLQRRKEARRGAA